MSNIITIAEAKSLKDIGKPIPADELKVNNIIEEAQLTDLKDTLGNKMYFDLVNHLEDESYQDLLSGSSFTHQGVNYKHDGIKALLADYFMARYVLTINTNFTPFGATVKHSQDSEPAPRDTLKDKSTMQRQLAGARWETIKMYLDANTATFTNWATNNSDEGQMPSQRTFRFRKI